MSTFRASLRRCAERALFVARTNPKATFFIVRHPRGKYYSLCDADELERVLDSPDDANTNLCFAGSAGELLSIMKHPYVQEDIFPHGEEILDLSKQSAPQPSTDPAEVNDEN